MSAIANGGNGHHRTVPRAPSYSIGSTVDPRVTSAAVEAVRLASMTAARLVVVRECSDEAELADVLGALGIPA
jgi:hypothetical protein